MADYRFRRFLENLEIDHVLCARTANTNLTELLANDSDKRPGLVDGQMPLLSRRGFIFLMLLLIYSHLQTALNKINRIVATCSFQGTRGECPLDMLPIKYSREIMQRYHWAASLLCWRYQGYNIQTARDLLSEAINARAQG